MAKSGLAVSVTNMQACLKAADICNQQTKKIKTTNKKNSFKSNVKSCCKI